MHANRTLYASLHLNEWMNLLYYYPEKQEAMIIKTVHDTSTRSQNRTFSANNIPVTQKAFHAE